MAWPSSSLRIDAGKLAVVVCGAIAFAYAVALAMLFVRHLWILDGQGRPLVTDFMEVWVAGLSVLNGHPAAPYDWHAHHAAQVAAIGHPFLGFLGWHYPPPVLFLAGTLALMPYACAFIAWVCVSTVLYAAALWKITGRPETALVALAIPAALGNALVGQNGFFTAAVIGASLFALENRPWLAGLFLGVLTYKPQFGLLFPLVLLFDGNWRALISATLTTLVLLTLTLTVFGTEPFVAFFHFLPVTADTILGQGTAGFDKLQSVYGLVRWLGAASSTAWLVHGFVALVAASGAIWLWRSEMPFALKAAGLATATLLATPYLYMYDFPLLAVPFAFLFRSRGFDSLEVGTAVATSAMMAIFAWTALPIGPLLVLLTVFLIVRRAWPLASPDVALQSA